ncbi:hypothetical protein L6452_03732 [Arctium lappa]|uniref:Uncharacterized protein n=1 Tax=Arctium lappa TaxID=4217 RepID=A0ACB9FN21_ARCLA|nr:hypothetical protein L6452_03732 [Arctium lappa]
MIMASAKVKIAEAAGFSHEDPLGGGTLMSVGLLIGEDEALQLGEDAILTVKYKLLTLGEDAYQPEKMSRFHPGKMPDSILYFSILLECDLVCGTGS